ncbi:squalene synthase [Aspergillus filifer]
MGFLDNVLYFTLHPLHLQYILQRKYFRKDTLSNLTPFQKVCLHYLDKTGRSYSFVIKSIHAELLFPVAIFYLILRGLDTIEDDGSIPSDQKVELLRRFKDVLDIDGWTFTENGEGAEDRDLLLNFDNVITEFKNLKPAYREVMKDITAKMGSGMAKYTCTNATSVNTINEYDEYCWYVAGLVGEGLTRLFIEAGFVDRALLERKHLYKSMGLLLQKTNIIRDVHEDYVDGRRFWPEEIWSNHVEKFDSLFDSEKGHTEGVLDCSTHMILNALSHVEDCLTYVSALMEPSIFGFCAIPEVMALSTLELCFRNPESFERNLKISKRDAIGIMYEVETGGMSGFCAVVSRYTKRIEEKCLHSDPNFVEMRGVCAKIEKTIDALLRSQRTSVRGI